MGTKMENIYIFIKKNINNFKIGNIFHFKNNLETLKWRLRPFSCVTSSNSYYYEFLTDSLSQQKNSNSKSCKFLSTTQTITLWLVLNIFFKKKIKKK